jgi:hypothetical protein
MKYGLAMKEYDLISIGTGSAMYIVDAMLQRNPNLKVAVIDRAGRDLSHSRMHTVKDSSLPCRDDKYNKKSK